MDDDTAGTDAPTARESLLIEVMAAAAAGDSSSVFALRESFGPEIERSVRGIASARGVRLSADEVDQLAIDTALELFGLAKAWDPSFGVPPWVWARHRVTAVVDAHIGQHTRPLEVVESVLAEAPAPPAARCEEPSVVEVIEQLAAEDRSVALVWEALLTVASARDRALFLEVLVQTSLGDRAAAATVADLVGMKPDAVRQQSSRIRRRLRDLAAANPRYADLADLAIVA
jgi:hypothetical protein